MYTLLKQSWVVDIQGIRDAAERRIIFDALNRIDLLRGNDLMYSISFEEYYEEQEGKFIPLTAEQCEDLTPEYVVVRDILRKYVDDEILAKGFVFSVWW